jgi:hypothetical protein
MPGGLTGAGGGDAAGNQYGRLPRIATHEVGPAHGADGDLHIQAIEQGPGNALAVVRHHRRCAGAGPIDLPEVAADAGLRCHLTDSR